MTAPHEGESLRRPAPRSEQASRALAIPDLVADLRRILGIQLLAYIAGVPRTSAVTAWVDGSDAPDEIVDGRLRLAHRIARLLEERYSASTIQTWFKGSDPTDDEPAPATLLRTSDPDTIADHLLAAATGFAFVS